MSAENMYWINFTENNEKFCFSLHYNRVDSYLLVNGIEIYKSKVKDCNKSIMSGSISKDWTLDNIKNWIKWISLWFWWWLWCYCSWWYIRYSWVLNERE